MGSTNSITNYTVARVHGISLVPAGTLISSITIDSIRHFNIILLLHNLVKGLVTIK